MVDKIDLNIVSDNDEMDSKKWYYIDSEFNFMRFIKKKIYNDFSIENRSVLIHRQVFEGERFPSSRYHCILNDECLYLDGKGARKIMSINLRKFISKNKKLPFGCSYVKTSKNGFAVFNYEPIENLNFQLKIKESEVFDVENLEQIKENKLSVELEIQNDIEPLFYNQFDNYIPSGSKIQVKDGIIDNINRRSTTYLDNISYYYILRLSNCFLLYEKISRKVDINVKCSYNAMKKYELIIGDKITFNGRLKISSTEGLIIQNVRKFVK